MGNSYAYKLCRVIDCNMTTANVMVNGGDAYQ